MLARLANSSDSQYGVASRAVLELHRRGEVLHVTPQVMIEFRNVATRAAALNGLGLSPSEAQSQTTGFETAFPLLVETPDIYPAWKAIVDGLGIVGKQVHDARIIAVCHAYKLTHLLTFNVAHFSRTSQFGAAVIVVHPSSI
jgi:hypothetical protein